MAAAAATPAEFFPQIKPVVFNPDAPASELLVFRHYNADVRLLFFSCAHLAINPARVEY